MDVVRCSDIAALEVETERKEKIRGGVAGRGKSRRKFWSADPAEPPGGVLMSPLSAKISSPISIKMVLVPHYWDHCLQACVRAVIAA